MSTLSSGQALDRFAQIGDLALRVRRLIDRTWVGVLAALGLTVAVLFGTRNPGANSFMLIALGFVITIAMWRRTGIGLPILPMMAVQNLAVYGMPILVQNEVILAYPAGLLQTAGVEVLVFSCASGIAWSLAMQVLRPSPAVCYALPDFQHGGSDKLKRVGMNLVIAGTVYIAAQKLGWLDFLFAMLPAGSISLLGPLTTGITACGLFLVSLFIGTGELNAADRALFWGLLCVACLINASSFLLSGVTPLLIAVFTGLFWSKGRVPWRYLLIVAVALSFFNLGKFTMRGRYWQFGDEPAAASTGGFAQLPALYGEWTQASFQALLNPVDDTPPSVFQTSAKPSSHQSLLQRVNNLQNLLFVIDAVEVEGFKPLGGETYALIPPLLVPRIMWPDKPRTHAGQVLLNVHFGRQDLLSTFKTYVAWGLIPEAYGNFGPLMGSTLIGAAIGVFLAWLENVTARKLLLSLEGFVSFTVLLGMVNSFEMVASVLVTTIFQSVVPIIAVSLPFLRRMQISSLVRAQP